MKLDEACPVPRRDTSGSLPYLSTGKTHGAPRSYGGGSGYAAGERVATVRSSSSACRPPKAVDYPAFSAYGAVACGSSFCVSGNLYATDPGVFFRNMSVRPAKRFAK